MKNLIWTFSLVLLVGCTYQGEDLGNYIDDPKAIIKDPHYSGYQDKRDALESRYLKKEITYADYLEQVKELDDTYTKEVNERTKILDSTYSAE